MILLQNGWSSTFTTIFLGLLINSQTGYSGFYTGRIKEGMFEYSDLNGLMTAEEGATLCEEDLQCAGFTFRGVYSVDVPHELYFFHYVSTIHFSQKNPHFWGWTSYRVNRDYILMRGKLSSPELEVEDLNTWERGSTWELDLNQNPAEAERVCQQTTNCVGLAQFKQERVVMLESVQFWDRSSSENWTTLVSLHPGNNQILDRDTTNINKCCPETPFFTEIDISNTEIPMMIKKIRCNISKEEFLENYVKKRIPVILKGCLNKSWFPNPRSEYQRFAGLSFEETLERLFYRGNETSTTVSRPKLRRRLIETMRKNNFKIDYNKAERLYMESSASVENSSTHSFTHVKTPNDAHFLYKDLVKHRSRGDLRVFLKLSYLKSRLDCYQQYRIPGTLELLPGYEQCLVLDGLWKPPPMPDDLYAITKYNNDLAWIIMSSRNTGSQMHTDPDFMGAWNLLLTGRKWWVVLPYQAEVADFNCDSKCSGKHWADGSNSYPWFKHILPQIRDKKYYGKEVLEFVQLPGEVLYLPYQMPHTIFNIDDNIALTENYLFMDALPELVKGMAINMIKPFIPNWNETLAFKTLYNKYADKIHRKEMRENYAEFSKLTRKYSSVCLK